MRVGPGTRERPSGPFALGPVPAGVGVAGAGFVGVGGTADGLGIGRGNRNMVDRSGKAAQAAADAEPLEVTAVGKRIVQKRRVPAGGWTKARRETFLGVLAQTCNVALAGRAVGMSASAPYELRRRDPAFAELFSEALALGYERLEGALISHALVGLNAIDVAALPMPGRDALAPGETAGAAMPGVAPTAEVTRAGIELALALLKLHRPSVHGGGKRWVPPALPTAAESDRQLLARLEMLATKRARQAKSLALPASVSASVSGPERAAVPALPAPDEERS